MDGDGLVDVAVGAQGAAVVLRSRWILQVAAAVSVEPAAVSVTRRNCRRGGSGAVCLRARLCFRAQSRSRSAPPGHGSLRYNASLEERGPGSRAAFDSGARRLLQRRVELPLGRQSCARVPFHVLDTSDYLRPLSLSLTWALDEAASGSVLDEASPTSLRKLIPFFKDCGDDDECVTDLVLKATTDIVGSRQSPHVLRKGRRRMLVEVELENRKENAYNASLWLQLPGNLHFSSLVLQEPSSVKLECSALGGQRRRCSVGYPVFRSQAKVSFTLELEFSCSVLLDRAELTLRATSDSREVTPQDNVVELSVPIRYEANVFLSSATNLPRYELHPLGTFSSSAGPEFTTTLKVQNLGCHPLQNLTLHMALPALGHRGAPILSVTRLLAANASCRLHPPSEGTPVPPEELRHSERLDCSSSRCRGLSCGLAGLGRGGGASIELRQRLHESSFGGVKFRSLRIVSSVWLGVEGGLFVLEEGAQHREIPHFPP
ncbi:integrin alpha-10-like [Melospiza melodia melodia]|uniref:integrin alpha-10-like n=1 Tax=Melospiza melodia melodia TaxID=1914991 RepID=UPI002FD60DB1